LTAVADGVRERRREAIVAAAAAAESFMVARVEESGAAVG
jgi:hypothetical protein